MNRPLTKEKRCTRNDVLISKFDERRLKYKYFEKDVLEAVQLLKQKVSETFEQHYGERYKQFVEYTDILYDIDDCFPFQKEV